MSSENNHEALIQAIRQRTENYYDAHGLCCSEAILFVVNRGFGGGLGDDMVRRLGAGFCGGMGGGDGACGALSGAVAALGLILGPGQPLGLSKTKMRQAAKKLHDLFRAAVGSTVCHDLTAPYADSRRARLKSCLAITGLGAELCARVILECRPEFADKVDLPFLNRRDTKTQAVIQKISAYF
ncbi:MAG: C-GCAxxG-C-C family protein [Desulfobulbaceae bacterium]|nr:C-GCAxxG-C-C family protein [Desulfobulbaceae bacterium]